MDNKEESIIVSNTETKEKAGIAENFAAPSVENASEKAKVIPPVEQYVPGIMPVPQKKKSYAGRVVALAVCCTLTGALLGAGGVIAFNVFHGHGRMRMGGFRQGAGVVRQFDRQNFGDNDSNNSSGTRQKGSRPNRNQNNRNNQNNQNNQGTRNKNGKSGFGNGFNGNRGQHGQNRGGRRQDQQNRQDQSGQQNNGNAQAPNANAQAPNGQAPDGNAQAPNGQAPAADTGNAN